MSKDKVPSEECKKLSSTDVQGLEEVVQSGYSHEPTIVIGDIFRSEFSEDEEEFLDYGFPLCVIL